MAERLGAREDGGGLGTARDLAAGPPDGIRSPRTLTVRGRKLQYGEGLKGVLSHPGSELWLGGLIRCDRVVDEAIGLDLVRCGEDSPDAARDFASQGELGDVMRRVALEVKLAALPRSTREGGVDGRLEAQMAVAGNQANATEAAELERFKELPPVHL